MMFFFPLSILEKWKVQSMLVMGLDCDNLENCQAEFCSFPEDSWAEVEILFLQLRISVSNSAHFERVQFPKAQT